MSNTPQPATDGPQAGSRQFCCGHGKYSCLQNCGSLDSAKAFTTRPRRRNKERHTGRLAKPPLLWFDFTSELQDPELRVVCARFFRVAYSTRCNRVAADIENLTPSVLCFDFDHPDQHRLQTLQDVKKAYSEAADPDADT